MATADHDSSVDVNVGPASSGPQIWLDGDVLSCACPDCGAPMSIRLWLFVADCWRCGASIELTEAEQRDALRLLRDQETSRRTETRQAGASITPTMLPTHKVPPLPVSPPPVETPAAPSALPVASPPVEAPPQRGRDAARTLRGARARIREIYRRGSLGVFLADMIKDLPAWLVSLVVHLVAILLLGIWVSNPPESMETVTLATSVSEDDIEGDTDVLEDLDAEAFEFDDPGPITVEELAALDPGDESEVVLESEPVEAAPELLGMLDELSDFSMVMPTASPGHILSGRNPAARAQLVRQEGGTTETEAAVARGLKWLARHQNADGSWSLHAWHRAPRATGPGQGLGGKSDTAGTALALLPFLGAGQTHTRGEYSDEVFGGLRWLIEHQKENGDLRGEGIGRMYGHGQATIALCEAYALTADDQLREPAQKALNFIVDAQHPAGGWRYEPGQAGDMSVVGWQLMALRSGKMAYLYVPPETFTRADRFLDSVATDRYQSQYGYMPGNGPSHVMTAEALLCREYLGWPQDHKGLNAGAHYLLNSHPPSARSPNMYYWYYATQMMHHLGGTTWNRWNALMRDVLVNTQEKQGPLAGSWAPRGGHSNRGGRIYMTALAICTLEVYYRHLPMYRPDVVQEFQPHDPDAPVGGIELEATR